MQLIFFFCFIYLLKALIQLLFFFVKGNFQNNDYPFGIFKLFLQSILIFDTGIYQKDDCSTWVDVSDFFKYPNEYTEIEFKCFNEPNGEIYYDKLTSGKYDYIFKVKIIMVVYYSP